jgi:hypothetical protein
MIFAEGGICQVLCQDEKSQHSSIVIIASGLSPGDLSS